MSPSSACLGRVPQFQHANSTGNRQFGYVLELDIGVDDVQGLQPGQLANGDYGLIGVYWYASS